MAAPERADAKRSELALDKGFILIPPVTIAARCTFAELEAAFLAILRSERAVLNLAHPPMPGYLEDGDPRREHVRNIRACVWALEVVKQRIVIKDSSAGEADPAGESDGA
jgi:hypothetical protein